MSDEQEQGAFRTLWDLGFHRLVPIVPPDAEISERSSIHVRMQAGDDARGKVPGVRGRDGKWSGLSLVKMESKESFLDDWAAMGAGVGIKTGEGLIALDIDTKNDTAARGLYELAAEMLGPAAVRFGNKPKCLMLYEAPEDLAYMQLRFETETEPFTDDGARGGARVEILTEGRQFVAAGTHPGTGRPYAWPRGIPRRDALTRVTREQIDAFMDAAAAKLGGKVASRHRVADSDVDQESLRAPSWDRLVEVANQVPNNSTMFPSRDSYVEVAYALRAAAPDGHDLEARDLYLDWCSRWEEGDNDLRVALRDWDRAKPPFRVGFNWLCEHAPGAFFAPVDGEEAENLDDMFAAAKEATKQPLYPLVSIGDLDSLPNPEFLIDRHIPLDGLVFLYGPPGENKTFIVTDMSLHVAYGLPDWHGDPIRIRGAGGVLYIAGEGSSGFKTRVAAWKKGRLLPEGATPNLNFLFAPVNFMRHEDIARLIETVAAAYPEGLSLIVVDTVSRAIPGADENLQKDMTLFVNACEALRHRTGATVIGVHHTSKEGKMRGSSVFQGQGDSIIRVEKSKKGPLTFLTMDKQKESPDGWRDAYRMETVELGERDGKPVTSLVPRRIEAGSEATAGRLDAETAKAMQDAITAAWRAKEPLSMEARAKERYAVRVLAEQFSLQAEEVQGLLDLWLATGVTEIAAAAAGGRKKGLRVIAGGAESITMDVFG